MLKCFCNKCEKELPKGQGFRCDVKVRGFSAVRDTFDCDYCEECLASIIGKEDFAEIQRREAERKKRLEERKRAQGEENNGK